MYFPPGYVPGANRGDLRGIRVQFQILADEVRARGYNAIVVGV
jgi:hypothetical protein